MTDKPSLVDRIFKNPKLEHDLRSAHITIAADQYMMLTLLMTMFSGVLLLMLGVCLTVFGIELPLPIPLWVIIVGTVILVPALQNKRKPCRINPQGFSVDIISLRT